MDWLTPCLDAQQMRAIDRWAIEQRGVPSLDLMEAAGRAVAEAASALDRPGPIRVVCGKGNNGGDGLVAARHLAAGGHRVEVFLLADRGELTGDAASNLERFPDARQPDPAELPALLKGSAVVVDAIFGTGFAGESHGVAATAIEAINAAEAPVVAADIASGVDASSGEIRGVAVAAAVTVGFHAAKIGHLVAPGKWRAGRLEVVPIGIPDDAPVRTHAGTITPDVLALAPRRNAQSTKFSSGRVVVIGGSRGLTGAPCLAAAAAIRAGAGYVTAAVPADLEQIVESKLTEVITVGLASREGRLRAAASEQALSVCEGAAAVLIGPGLGRDPATFRLVGELAGRITAPLVLDADGLNAHAGRLELLAGRSAPTVLTPHSGELARLLGGDPDSVSATRLESALAAARGSGSIVVHKGDDTIVTDGELIAINATSAPALATAGTGDVLAGMIAAMIARGMDPLAGVSAAVLAHARAGLAAAGLHGSESVIASDVIAAIGEGLRP